MLYGRLNDDNAIAEIIDRDPTGRYPDAIQWVKIPDDFGLLTTKNKNALLMDIKNAQAAATKEDFVKLNVMKNQLQNINDVIENEKEKLAANGVDIDAVYAASQAPEEEEAEAAE